MEVNYCPHPRLLSLSSRSPPSTPEPSTKPKSKLDPAKGPSRKHGTCKPQRAQTVRHTSTQGEPPLPKPVKKRTERVTVVGTESRPASPHPTNPIGRTQKLSAPPLESHKFLKTIKAPNGGLSGTNPKVPSVSEVCVRLIVIGAKQVGKSALTVRYLTKRFIGEYKSHTDLCYRQCIPMEGQLVEVEIIDVSDLPDAPWNLPIHRIRASDAAIVVYSITDRKSFHIAREAIDVLATLTPPVEIPVLVLANKTDLNHLRKVSISDGRDLSRQYNTAFHEVSVADDPIDTINVMNRVIRELWIAKMEAHRNLFLLSPPLMQMFQSRLAVPPEPGRSKSQDPPVESKEKKTSGTTPSAKTDQATSTQTQTDFDRDKERSRKHTVFSMGRVFSHLMGRGSLPPDLPSSSSSSVGVIHVKERGMSTDRLSLKKVFKKRSV